MTVTPIPIVAAPKPPQNLQRRKLKACSKVKVRKPGRVLVQRGISLIRVLEMQQRARGRLLIQMKFDSVKAQSMVLMKSPQV